MARRRDKPEDILSKLRQIEVLQGQGMTIADAVRQIGMTEQTYYRWRKQYGGMSRDQLWTLLKKVEASCDRYLIAGGTNVEAEWEQGPAI